MNVQLYFIILLLLTYFYFSFYKKAIIAHLDIDLWPHLWCLKAIFIIMCLGISRQVKILKIVFTCDCTVQYKVMCPFHLIFPDMYYYLQALYFWQLQNVISLVWFAFFLLNFFICLLLPFISSLCSLFLALGEESYSGEGRGPTRASLPLPLLLFKSWLLLSSLYCTFSPTHTTFSRK